MPRIFDYGIGGKAGPVWGGESAGAPQPQGLLGSYSPQVGGIFAALQDAGAYLGGGGRTDNFAQFNQQNQQNQMRQQLLQGLTSEDPAIQKQAILGYAASGGDVSPIVSAMSFGQHKIEHYGEGENVYDVDPLTGTRKQIQVGQRVDNAPHEGVNPLTHQPGQYLLKNGVPSWLDVGVLPKPPQTRNLQRGLQSVEQQWNPQTGRFEDIPGTIGPRFKPETPKPAGSGGTFGNPAALFGGRR